MQQETVLTRIVADKALWIKERQQQQPLSDFQHAVQPSERSFYQAVKNSNCALILECKKASPSKGVLRADFDPVQIAKTYQPYASAISVLTDEKYFQGNFAFLPQVSAAVSQPVLCKDFIIDPYQIWLARYYQADAILLMLSVLNDEQYRELAALAHQLHMGILTEVSNETELNRAIELNAQVVGINNRDLRDLSIDLNRTRQLAPRLPADVAVISESGIGQYADMRKLSHYANGFLIGSALMAEADLNGALRRLIFGENKVCGLTRPADALAAYRAGAIYGGLIFVTTSPRIVSPQQARQIMSAAPLNYVGVFRDTPPETVAHLAQELGLYAVQLHGQETLRDIDELRALLPAECQIWRAISMSIKTTVTLDMCHIDRYVLDNAQGGSGKVFDWSLIPLSLRHKAMLAGGITPENCQQAAAQGCIGLDINSGVEDAPGIKNSQLLIRLFNRLRCS